MLRVLPELHRLFLFALLTTLGATNSQGAMTAQKTNSDIGIPSTYTLGPDDQFVLLGIDAEEIVNKPFRIGPDGEVSLPMIGRLPAAGLTIPQFEETLNKRLEAYIREPNIVVSITEFRSQPVSVVGAVKLPGTHQLEGRKTLVEMIALAGGFREDVGNTIKITRELEWGAIPLPNATIDSSGKYSVAEVEIKEMFQANNPLNNILVMPHDVISVPRAELVYVIGDVKKSGGFVLTEQKNMSVLQALSLAEGLGQTADASHAKILRVIPGQEQRTQITVNVKKILESKSDDVPLQSGDILFLPVNTGKKVGMRSMEAIVQTATGVAVFRR
jgi:polysaccharide biosynthesis/export protein